MSVEKKYMEIMKAKNYFSDIRKSNLECDEYRLEEAYVDILMLIEIYEDILSKLDGVEGVEFLKEGLIDEFVEIKNTERKLATLLRSLYLISSSFINILLYDCGYRSMDRTKQTTLPQLFNSPEKTSCYNNKEQLISLFDYSRNAYLLQVYRNNYIAHSDKRRALASTNTFTIGEGNNRLYRLFPMPIDKVNRSYMNETINLLNKYNLRIPNSPNDCLTTNELTDLFYKVPLVINDKINKDERDIIYKIMGGSCIESMNYIEILDAIDKFIEGISQNIIVNK